MSRPRSLAGWRRLWCESGRESAPRLPRRARRVIRDGLEEASEKLVEARRPLGIPRLFQVVQRTVIPLRVPAPVGRLFLRSWVIPKDERERRDASLNEIPLIRPPHQHSVGFQVRSNLDAHRLADAASRIAERRVVESQGGENGQRKDRTKRIEIDVGDDPISWHGGMADEIL